MLVTNELSLIDVHERRVLDHLALAKSVLTKIPKQQVIDDLEHYLDVADIDRIRRYQLSGAYEFLTNCEESIETDSTGKRD